jgi:hypothetical protein
MLSKILDHKYSWHIIIAIIILLAVYFFINKKNKDEQYELFLKAIDDPSTVSGESSDKAKYANAWDTSYYKKVKGASLLPQTSLSLYIDKIKKADKIGPMNDDQAVIDIFNKLTYKTQVSQLADAYKTKYSENLLDFIKGILKSSNLELVLNKVNSLK